MTWRNRFRLLGGLLTVTVVVAAATFHLNDSQARVESSSARIAAESYTVGTPYAGVVVERMVEVDTVVAEGDPMFLIDSANLQRDLAQEASPPRMIADDVDPGGYLIVRASGAGTVTALEGEVGTFVQESTEMATVQKEGSTVVEAAFVLTTQQYARLGANPRATVVLPDQQKITGDVAEFTVEDQDDQSRVVVTIESPELVAAEVGNRLVSAGAPVEAELHLENDGVVSDLAALVKGYVGTATGYVAGLVQGGTP
jgi:multidrug resistance efflux pump